MLLGAVKHCADPAGQGGVGVTQVVQADLRRPWRHQKLG